MFSEAREGKVEVCCEGIQLKGKLNNIREKKKKGDGVKFLKEGRVKEKEKRKAQKEKKRKRSILFYL